MALPALPPELIPYVVNELSPTDFESLAIACRRTYTLLTPFLAQHNKYRWAYHKVVVGRAQPKRYKTELDQVRAIGYAGSLDSVLKVVQMMARDPNAPPYVAHLDLEDEAEYGGTFNARELELECAGASHALHAVTSLINGAQHLDPSTVHAHWREYLEEGELGDREVVIIYLLSLMPDLRSLKLPRSFQG